MPSWQIALASSSTCRTTCSPPSSPPWRSGNVGAAGRAMDSYHFDWLQTSRPWIKGYPLRAPTCKVTKYAEKVPCIPKKPAYISEYERSVSTLPGARCMRQHIDNINTASFGMCSQQVLTERGRHRCMYCCVAGAFSATVASSFWFGLFFFPLGKAKWCR